MLAKRIVASADFDAAIIDDPSLLPKLLESIHSEK
jgi:hypothetical protein